VIGVGAVDRAATTYIAGHRGLVGSAVWRALQVAGFAELVGQTSAELDLRDRAATFEFFHAVRPRCVVLAAARVGGIGANAARPVEFLSDNVLIQTNVLDAALAVRVPRLLFLGSSCVYPRLAPQPIAEEALLGGPLEPTNEAYAIAKIAGLLQVRAVRRQHGLPWISAMPCNLYGPGDNVDPGTGHVLPALLHRAHEATVAGAPTLSVWGSGRPRREFLHVDDLAQACLQLLDHYDEDIAINVGTGTDVAIAELARTICAVVGFGGQLVFDPDRPDGTPCKRLDVSRLSVLGFRPRIGLTEGIRSTYDWYRSTLPAAPGPPAAAARPAPPGQPGGSVLPAQAGQPGRSVGAGRDS
jgi:GDP-L-fucose synthase